MKSGQLIVDKIRNILIDKDTQVSEDWMNTFYSSV